MYQIYGQNRSRDADPYSLKKIYKKIFKSLQKYDEKLNEHPKCDLGFRISARSTLPGLGAALRAGEIAL